MPNKIGYIFVFAFRMPENCHVWRIAWLKFQSLQNSVRLFRFLFWTLILCLNFIRFTYLFGKCIEFSCFCYEGLFNEANIFVKNFIIDMNSLKFHRNFWFRYIELWFFFRIHWIPKIKFCSFSIQEQKKSTPKSCIVFNASKIDSNLWNKWPFIRHHFLPHNH